MAVMEKQQKIFLKSFYTASDVRSLKFFFITLRLESISYMEEHFFKLLPCVTVLCTHKLLCGLSAMIPKSYLQNRR